MGNRTPFARATEEPSVPRKQRPGLRGLLRGAVETRDTLLPGLPRDMGRVPLRGEDVCRPPSCHLP